MCSPSTSPVTSPRGEPQPWDRPGRRLTSPAVTRTRRTVDMAMITIEEAIEDFKAGKFLIVVDDEDRENEGDLAIAAECVTADSINFMATHGRGLICTPV